MNAIKITRKIRSQTLRIQELEQFRGKTVDIIILAENDRQPHGEPLRSAAGMLSKYANPTLIEREQDAWERAVREKYADR